MGREIMKTASRTVKIILVLSLGLNLLVAGSLAGFFGSGRHKDPRIDGQAGLSTPGPRGSISAVGPLLRGLDRDQRRTLGRAIQQAMRETSSGDLRTDRRALNQEIADALTKVPFDPAVMEDLIGQSKSQMNQRLNVTTEILLMQLSEMTDAQRASLAERMMRPRGRN